MASKTTTNAAALTTGHAVGATVKLAIQGRRTRNYEVVTADSRGAVVRGSRGGYLHIVYGYLRNGRYTDRLVAITDGMNPRRFDVESVEVVTPGATAPAAPEPVKIHKDARAFC